MPSRSKAQQRFMGLVHAYKKGEVPASKVSKAVKDAAKSMKKKSTKDFASTKHDDLPNKVKEYLMSENPAASAAAAMVMMKLQNPSTGKKISAVTPLRDKDHPLHKKSKGIFQRLKDKFMKKNESVNEDGHTDVASIERKLKLIIQDSVDTIKKLRSMSNEDSLPSWWTDKITLAKDYVGKSRDYIMNPAESVNEISSYGEYVEDNARMLAQDYRRQDKKLAKALDHVADRINQSYPGRNKITKNDVKDIIKQPYDRKLMRPMMRFNLDDLFESVNEVSGVDVAKKVLKNKQMEKGLDLQTANLIVTIDKAYDKKPALQKKFRAIKLPKMKQLILKFGR